MAAEDCGSMLNGMSNDTKLKTTVNCPICGATVVRTPGRGRPRDYDRDVCRETAKLLGRLSSHLDKVRATGLTQEGERAVRRRVWSLLNATLNKRVAAAVAAAVILDIAPKAPNA